MTLLIQISMVLNVHRSRSLELITDGVKGVSVVEVVEVLLYVHRNRRVRVGGPGRPPRLSHSSRA